MSTAPPEHSQPRMANISNISNNEPRMNTDEHGLEKNGSDIRVNPCPSVAHSISPIPLSVDWVQEVLSACFEVSNALGSGFLEKVYERALSHEFRLRGIPHSCQQAIPVAYKGTSVGDYQADIIVDGGVLIELKCASSIAPEHIAQCLNYLKATGIRIGLIVNFGKPKVEWKRLVYG